MSRSIVPLVLLIVLTGVAAAGDPPDAGDKQLEGMSIVGNDEAPKSLVIVPWKSSGLVDSLDVSTSLNAGRQPVDRDVFMRELSYYRLRTESNEALVSGSE